MRVAPHVGPEVRENQEARVRRIRNFYINASTLGILSVIRRALFTSAPGAGSLEGMAKRILGSSARGARTEGVGDGDQPVSEREIDQIDFHASAGRTRTTAQARRHHFKAPSSTAARKEFRKGEREAESDCE